MMNHIYQKTDTNQDDDIRVLDEDYILSGGVSMLRQDVDHGFHSHLVEKKEVDEIFDNIERKLKHLIGSNLQIKKISSYSVCFQDISRDEIHLHVKISGKKLSVYGRTNSGKEKLLRLFSSVPRVQVYQINILTKTDEVKAS